MTTMRLARRTRSAVTNCDRCAERSTPWRAAAATASGGGGRPGPRKPAESTRTPFRADARVDRSEEHTSELQSPCNLVCRLLLEKKKKSEHQSRNPSECPSPTAQTNQPPPPHPDLNARTSVRDLTAGPRPSAPLFSKLPLDRCRV